MHAWETLIRRVSKPLKCTFIFRFGVIPFLNKRLSLTRNRFVVGQFIARRTDEGPIAFQNLYNAALFFHLVLDILIVGTIPRSRQLTADG